MLRPARLQHAGLGRPGEARRRANLTAGDVVTAIREQNTPGGRRADRPAAGAAATSRIQFTLSTLGRLVEPEQFEQIIVKVGPTGRPVVRIKDVARVELGAKSSGRRPTGSTASRPSSLAVFQLPDANALDTADVVKAKMDELSQGLPAGRHYEIGYDTTPFIRESIDEVFKTLRDAIILVAIVVLVFLQNWRAALIPLVAVPVAIVGTFAVMAAVGLQPQQPDAVRAGAGHRHRRGRRDRRRRGGRAHIEQRLAAARRDDPGDGRGVRPGHRRRAGAVGVFVPCAFISGIVGAVLPAVRADDRRLDDHLGVQLADAQPGALRTAAARPRGQPAATAGWRATIGLGTALRSRSSESCSTAGSPRPGAGTSRSWVSACAVPLFVLAGYVAIVGADVVGTSRRCRPASSRRRTRAICLSASSCPTRPARADAEYMSQDQPCRTGPGDGRSAHGNAFERP